MASKARREAFAGEEQAPAVRIEDDFHGWLLSQATALREHRIASLDWENLAEALEDMYVNLTRDLEADFRVVFEHLLKLEYEKSQHEWLRRSRLWKVDLIEHRRRIHTIQKMAPSLVRRLEEFVSADYPIAVRKVALQLKRPRSEYPAQCPWTVDQILNLDFTPNPFNLTQDD